MNTEVQIVFVEDVPVEAELVAHTLTSGGLPFRMRRVDTREGFLRELELHPPDVILSDHGLPSFDGLTALAVAREKCPQVPFIFVTTALTREMGIEKLVPGVTDIVLKSQLHLLAPTIRGVLPMTKTRQMDVSLLEKRERIAEKLVALLQEYEQAGGHLPICSNCKKIRDKQGVWLPPELFFMRHLELKFTHGICPDCIRELSK